MTAPSLRAQSVSKTFRVPNERYQTVRERMTHPLRGRRFGEPFEALADVSFDVQPGEFFGIAGKNGSGKSTLLRCLSGIYPVDQGEVELRGRLAPFIELGVGFNPEMTARDNVFVNSVVLGMSRAQARARVPAMLSFAEVEQFADLKLKNCSSGMSMRLAFSVTVQVDADILLFDEVLAVGDESFQRKCFDRFESLRDEGRTIVLVTHNMEWVERFCDRALLLDRGRVAALGAPEDVVRGYHELNKSSGGPTLTGRTPTRDAAPATRPPLVAEPRRFGALVLTLSVADFRRRYLDSALSYLWAIMAPFAFFVVLYLVFTQVASFDDGVPHYPLYLLTSLVLWTYFAESTATAVGSLVERAPLLRTVPMPALTAPLSVTLTSLLDLGMTMIAVFAFLLIAGIEPRVTWLELPLLVVFLTAFAAGVGTLLSALFVRYRDVDQIWQLTRQVLFYGSPIFYVAAALPDNVEEYLMANPLAVIFTQARYALLDPDAPTAAEAIGGEARLLVPLAIVAGSVALGLWAFHRVAPRAPEEV